MALFLLSGALPHHASEQQPSGRWRTPRKSRPRPSAGWQYDAAQKRGEVQGHGGQGKRDVPAGDIPAVTDLGLTRKAIHEARQLRDAETVSPGIVRRTLDQQLAKGKEPKEAAVREAVHALENRPLFQ